MYPVRSSKIAAYLLKIKAVKISIDPPFTWSSGWKSPIYCDNRLTLSYPEIRNIIKEDFADFIRQHYPHAQGIAGIATGAIAHGALVADYLDLPLIYIRSKPKSYGMRNLVEGEVNHEIKYVVIEDLISTGNSSASAVEALQQTGVQVAGTLAIFSYGLPQAQERFRPTGIEYHTLTGLEVLLEEAIALDYLDENQKEVLRDWQINPEIWTRA